MPNPPVPCDMRRIVVVGSSGSGKSTLASSLAEILDCKHIELDAHNFVSNWQSRPKDEFRARIELETRADSWVACGNYRSVRDITWPRADTLVFLDYAIGLVLWRLTKRSLSRTITRENLWGSGSRENFIKHLQWNDDSLYYWAITHHQQRRREYPLEVQKPEHAHLRFVHLTNPRLTRKWLEAVGKAYGRGQHEPRA